MPYKIRLSSGDRAAITPNAPLRYKKIALVCEGGGQRGIFTAGVLDSFLKADFFPFQLMIGTSAGAQNLSAYVCGQRGYGRHVITRFTPRAEFFNPVRFLRGGHLIDLDWLIKSTSIDQPLDIERAALRLQGRELLLCACRSEGEFAPEYFAVSPEKTAWLRAIKASSAIPLLYRGGVEVEGRRYWDGGVRDALPVREAYKRDADLIVVVRTLPHGGGEPPAWQLKMQAMLSKSRWQAMAKIAKVHEESYRASEAFIDQPPSDLKIVELSPSHVLKSSMLGSSLSALHRDYLTGQKCGKAFLEKIVPRLSLLPDEKAASKSV